MDKELNFAKIGKWVLVASPILILALIITANIMTVTDEYKRKNFCINNGYEEARYNFTTKVMVCQRWVTCNESNKLEWCLEESGLVPYKAWSRK